MSILLIFLCPAVFANNLKLSDVVRERDGSIAFMSIGDLNDYCKKEYGTRVPTIRELATFAQSRGARGFLPMDQCDTRWGWVDGKEYYGRGKYPVIYVNAFNRFNKSRDQFCFDMTGFQPEEGDQRLGSLSATDGLPNRYNFELKGNVISISFSGEFYGYTARCLLETP